MRQYDNITYYHSSTAFMSCAQLVEQSTQSTQLCLIIRKSKKVEQGHRRLPKIKPIDKGEKKKKQCHNT